MLGRFFSWPRSAAAEADNARNVRRLIALVIDGTDSDYAREQSGWKPFQYEYPMRRQDAGQGRRVMPQALAYWRMHVTSARSLCRSDGP